MVNAKVMNCLNNIKICWQAKSYAICSVMYEQGYNFALTAYDRTVEELLREELVNKFVTNMINIESLLVRITNAILEWEKAYNLIKSGGSEQNKRLICNKYNLHFKDSDEFATSLFLLHCHKVHITFDAMFTLSDIDNIYNEIEEIDKNKDITLATIHEDLLRVISLLEKN